MNHKALILGDIEVNTINGRILPENASYTINIKKIIEGKIEIPFTELKINSPIIFQCLVNDELFFPDINWLETSVILDFGYTPKLNEIIKIIYIFNT